MVKIRLTRIGRANVPVYRVIAVDSRKKRDGAFLEDLGTYDASKGKLVRFETERINYWISQGAQVSDVVKRLQRVHKTGAQAA
jgi:small subunit ribosomal protein S16